MKEVTLYAVVKIKIITDLSIDDAIGELSSESYYAIESTENVSVQETEWLETAVNAPL